MKQKQVFKKIVVKYNLKMFLRKYAQIKSIVNETANTRISQKGYYYSH
jgi:hypothetical protein